MEISKGMRGAVKPACWGAAGGAIALAIIGFTWGGWVTGGHAKTLAEAAVTTALVPICADKFQAGGALALSTLKAEKDDRDYDDIVIKFVHKVGDRTISLLGGKPPRRPRRHNRRSQDLVSCRAGRRANRSPRQCQ